MGALRSDLLVRILCDLIPPGALDAAYLYSESIDNEYSVLEAAGRVFREGLANRILIPASEPRSGYPGFGPWYAALRQRGIPEDMLLGVPPPEGELSTFHESLSLMRFCREQEFFRVAVVAAPFHQPRAYISAVSAAADEFRGCRVFSIPGMSLPWEEVVVHSKEQASRTELIEQELLRIDSQREKGVLIDDEMLLAYLENRDAHS